jgi:hypothetical protein
MILFRTNGQFGYMYYFIIKKLSVLIFALFFRDMEHIQIWITKIQIRMTCFDFFFPDKIHLHQWRTARLLLVTQ